METIHLLLGSNLGNRSGNLLQARQHISRQLGPVITGSSIYKTSAWGKPDQPDFYNQLLVVNTETSPHQALSIIHAVERDMGRQRLEKWGSRTIDIDILFWGNLILHDDQLTIPHPGIPERKFALIPLAEIDKDFIHPGTLKSISELLEACPDTLSVSKLDPTTNS